MNKSRCSFAIISDRKGNILLANNKKHNLISMIGGKAEKDEIDTDTMIRELEEETDIKLEDTDKFKKIDKYIFEMERGQTNCTVEATIYFLGIEDVNSVNFKEDFLEKHIVRIGDKINRAYKSLDIVLNIEKIIEEVNDWTSF